MTTQKKDDNLILWVIGAIIGIYLAYLIISFLAKLFVCLGYNLFFLLDNMLRVEVLHPVISWSIFGLFWGTLIGVIIAIKKCKLSKLLIFYPILFLALFITILCWVNKPAQYAYDFDFNQFIKREEAVPAAIPQEYYRAKCDLNVRAAASRNSTAILVLRQGEEVEMIQKGYYDARNAEWAKVKFNGQEGFVNIKFLTLSRSVH